MAGLLGDVIERESRRAIDQFGRFSDAQLRRLQRLYMDSRLRVNGIVAENWGTLAKAPATDYTVIRLRNIQAQIDVEIEALGMKLDREVPGMVNTAGEMGIKTGQGELARVLNKFPHIHPSFTIINRAAIEVYSEYALQLCQRYTEEVKRQIQSALRQGVIEGQSVQQLTTKIRQYMGAEYRKPAKAITYNATRVARTEMARAYGAGHQAYGKSVDFVVGERWHVHSIGPWPCADCEGYEGLEFLYKAGDPPNIPVHPNCRCYTTYLYKKELFSKEELTKLGGIIKGGGIPVTPFRGHIKSLSDTAAIKQILEDGKKAGLIISRAEGKQILDSMRKYSGIYYRRVRAFQAGTRIPFEVGDMAEREIVRRVARDVEKFIKFTPSYRNTIYRGISSKRGFHAIEVFGKLKKNMIVDMKGCSSWSSDIKQATRFAGFGDDPGGVIFVVKKPMGKSASTRYLSFYPKEEEVLVSRAVKCRVVSSPRKIGKHLFIELELIE